MQDNRKQYPCWHCSVGFVTFFRWFRDEHGTHHHASTYGKKVFVRCSNPQCPGRDNGSVSKAA